MVAIFAIALPIILAVMGVLVALNPPPADGAVHWLWVGAFALVGLIAIGVGIKDRLNADDAQDRLQTEIRGLRDAVDKMSKPVPAAPLLPARDPDSLYQNQNKVGSVTGARITLNESKVYFEQVENAGNLDTQKEFEYRDYVLRWVRADRYIGMLVQAPGGVHNNVYQRVVCEIVGRVHR